jgi:putative transposase
MNAVFPQRRNTWLAGYDYTSAGFYFVTICTKGRSPVLGDVANDTMLLNEIGRTVDSLWSEMFGASGSEKIWIVMPNHLHGIIEIADDASHKKSLGRLVAAFKTISTKRINEIRGTPGSCWWQRNFYEHVIGNEKAFARIVGYIRENPVRWEGDPENPRAYRAHTSSQRL